MTGKDMPGEDVERLLRAEARAGLPFGTLLRLYLHPFSLFMDASRGPLPARRRAASYNRAHRGMLLIYARRWLLLAAFAFAAVAPFELAAAKLPAAAMAVSCCVALVVTGWTLCVYLLLGARRY